MSRENHHIHDEDSVDGDDFEDDTPISPNGNEEDWDKGVAPFVRKLHKLVSENREHVDWSKDGAFMVKDVDIFSTILLPKYFKAIKLCSFVRQLNMYNFHKVEDAPNANPRSMEFKNEFFQPGRKDLYKKIQRRKTVKRINPKHDDEDMKKKSAPEHRVASSSGESSLLESRGLFADDSNCKYMIQTMAKLQHQTEMNQLALKQVLEELNSYRKANYELEQKVSQLTAQVNSSNLQNTNLLIQNMLLQQQHPQLINRTLNPLSQSPSYLDLLNVHSPTLMRNMSLGNSMGINSASSGGFQFNAYNSPDVTMSTFIGTPPPDDNSPPPSHTPVHEETTKLSLDILHQPLNELENQYEFGF